MIVKKRDLYIFLYALFLFLLPFWFSGIGIMIPGLLLIVMSAFYWRLKGGLLSSLWVSGLLFLAFLISPAEASALPLLIKVSLLLLIGVALSPAIDFFQNQKESQETEWDDQEEIKAEEYQGLITILNSIDSIIYVADMDTYELLFINSYGQEKWGNIPGKKCWEVIQKDQRGPCSFCTNDKLLDEEGKPTGVYQWVMNQTKNNRIYSCRDRAVQWIDGRLVRLQIATDITADKAAEERLKRSEALLRASQRLTRVGGWEWDVKKESMYWTEEAYLLHDFEPGELVPGTPEHIAKSMECYLPEDRPTIQEAFQNCVKNGQAYDLEFPFITAKGRELWIRTLAQPVIEGGETVRVIGNIMDITKHKEGEKSLEEYAAEIELRNLELENVYQYLDGEIEKAIHIHQRTLPKTLPQNETLSMAAFYQPAEKMGGDFYDSIQKGRKLISYVSDVTGHGLESALLSTFVQDMVKSYIIFTPEKNIRAGEILQFLYEEYQKNRFPEDYFVCIYLTVLQLDTLELEYIGAGFQENPLLSQGGEKQELIYHGLPISSTFPQELLNFSEKRITLSPAATLLLYTDGITEQEADGNLYGQRLPEVFYKNVHHPPSDLAQIIKEDFQQFNQGSYQGNDDITFLILQLRGSENQ